MAEKVNGVAVGAIAVGGFFVYAGIKGYSIPQTFQAVVQGKAPTNLPQADPVATPTDSAAGGASLGVQGSAPVSTGHYSHAQLVSLWTSLGGSAGSANNAACHAIQESGGDPQATSSNPDGGENVGLWQLDTKGVGSGHSVSSLMNAQNNCRITIFATKNGTDWSEWATPGC